MKSLISAEEIRHRVQLLGLQLSEHYQHRPLTVVSVLTGSLMFVADLVREITTPHRLGVVHASSYRGKTTVPGDLQISLSLVPDIRGRDVLLVDDIFDTGQTLERVVKAFESYAPASVRTATLLWKDGRSTVDRVPDYHCFRIPNVFVVGYGLDYNDDFRHLPYIAEMESQDL